MKLFKRKRHLNKKKKKKLQHSTFLTHTQTHKNTIIIADSSSLNEAQRPLLFYLASINLLKSII